MGFGAFLVALVGPMTARVLASLGLSLVVMTGIVATIDSLKATMLDAANALAFDVVALCGLFGVWECVALALGGITFCVTWMMPPLWLTVPLAL